MAGYRYLEVIGSDGRLAARVAPVVVRDLVGDRVISFEGAVPLLFQEGSVEILDGEVKIAVSPYMPEPEALVARGDGFIVILRSQIAVSPVGHDAFGIFVILENFSVRVLPEGALQQNVVDRRTVAEKCPGVLYGTARGKQADPDVKIPDIL